MESLFLGLDLLAVGMPTVFAVLGLVVLSGFILQKHLIPAFEKWFPEEKLSAAPSGGRPDNLGPISSETLEVIASAINVATKGKYKVLKVEKLKN